MICPKCRSIAVGKEVTRRGWSGDYACFECGYNDAKDGFQEIRKPPVRKIKWKLKEQPKLV